ncbi:hypothetical protein [Catenulispora rubra]|uniref:hypothetical protein n=1 Tax=Catenulispora rubra TaxID=280293 RepID=UPI001891FFD0|nr:hypothetical protein [Catenulispora rubra]
MPGYPALAEGLKDLKLRHLADLLASSAPFLAETDGTGRPRFRLLDGFWLARKGGRWQRVDGEAIRELRPAVLKRFKKDEARADALLGVLEAIAGRDEGPALLRHALIYQVIMAAHTAAGDPAAVTDQHLKVLGVHSDEAAAAARLARAAVPLGQLAAAAAEELLDAVEAHRLGRARVLVSRLPPGHGDWRLAELCGAVERDAAGADGLFAEAERHEDAGRLAEAMDCLVRGIALMADDHRRGRDALVRVAVRQAERALADGMRTALRLAPVGDGVRILRPQSAAGGPGGGPGGGWAGDSTDATFTLLRVAGHRDAGQVVLDRTGLTDPVVDTAVEFGRTVRYVAIPMRGGSIAGAALASGPLRYAPEIDAPLVTERPDGIRMTWRPPPRAVEVEAVRATDGEQDSGGPVARSHADDRGADDRGAGGAAAASGPGPSMVVWTEGLDDPDVRPGRYAYTVRCGYPLAGSPDLVWSEGVTIPVLAEEWPLPVPSLDVEAADGDHSVLVRWKPPLIGTDRVVLWPFGPADPGSDISGLIRRVPAGLALRSGPDSRRSAETAVRPGTTLHIMAVSELQDRAVAGASALVQVLEAPTDLCVERNGTPGEALVRFSWPDPAVLVAIEWETDAGFRREYVAQSGFPTGGYRIAVGRAACEVTVRPCGRPDAALTFGAAAVAALPELPEPAPPGSVGEVEPEPDDEPDNEPDAQAAPARRRRKWWAPWTWFRLRFTRRRSGAGEQK